MGSEYKITGSQAAVAGAVISLLAGAIGAVINGVFNRDVAQTTSTSAENIEKTRILGALELERLKFESGLILKALETNDQEQAIKRLRFFASAGLIPNHKKEILALTGESDRQQIPTIPTTPTPSRGCKYERNNLTYAFANFTEDLPESSVRAIVRTAFQIWAEAANLRIAEAEPFKMADFRISWATGEHGDGSAFDVNTLAHAFFPPPCGGLRAGEIHFNEAVDWNNDPSSADGNLLSIAIHQIGHILGLSHSSDSNSVMSPFAGQRIELADADVQAIQALYEPTTGALK